MVEWICKGCNNYNSKFVLTTKQKAYCTQCNLERNAVPPKKAVSTPTIDETNHFLSQELLKPTPPVAPSQPLPPVHYDEQPPLPDIDLVDPRCRLGAHVCRYCNEGFLVQEQQGHDVPEELGGRKRK